MGMGINIMIFFMIIRSILIMLMIKGRVINYLWGGDGRHSHIFNGIFVLPLRFM